jgi:hypothetical protein
MAGQLAPSRVFRKAIASGPIAAWYAADGILHCT